MRKIIRRAAAVLLSAALLLTGTASAAAQIDPVEERLAAMSLREKVGQLFVVRVEALDPSGQSDSTRLTWTERQGLKCSVPDHGIGRIGVHICHWSKVKIQAVGFEVASDDLPHGTGIGRVPCCTYCLGTLVLARPAAPRLGQRCGRRS